MNLDADNARVTPGPLEPRDIYRRPGILYVFAYGSLLWRPGFSYLWREKGRVYGFHRALRVWSVHHRGTEDRPGLVLGLDGGGSCVGGVFAVDRSKKREVAEYLWAREMVTSVYVPRIVTAHLADRRRLECLTFVLDREHTQYSGLLTPADAAAHIEDAAGASGANPEYVRQTLDGLHQMGVHDQGLLAVWRQLEARRSGRSRRD